MDGLIDERAAAATARRGGDHADGAVAEDARAMSDAGRESQSIAFLNTSGPEPLTSRCERSPRAQASGRGSGA